LEAFGADRLMWGSDWPVLNLNGDYAAWMAAAEQLLEGLSDTEREAIFGGTASVFYGLDRE
jgi:L-fuconolactonase